MIEQLFMGDQAADPVSFHAVLLGMLLAFLCGQVVAWTYMFTHSGLSYSRTYVNSLVIIPLLVSMVMMVLSNNLITAFGLMALFAIVRFRNILRDTLDTCYILAGITLGMACGTGRYGTAVAGLAVICGILAYLSFTSFGGRHRYDMILNLHWSRPMAELPSFMALLNRHARKALCASQRVHDGESGIDLSYRLLLRDPDRMEDLLDEVRACAGASRVTGLSAQDESEL
ncbi:MAG: DUF4956 domain-containing protein [Puniceicoccaceae bacterium]|nr:MAG: DUF4956 domain-containing protein [Puniceicoccaceae bacterium]